MCELSRALAWVWRSEDNLLQWVLYHVGPWDQIQVITLGNKCRHQLSHFTSIPIFILT